VPDLAGAIETKAVLVDALDRLAHLVVAPGTSRTPAGIGKAGSVFVVGRRGDRQFAADRLDPQFFPVSVNQRHHHLPWRSSSACAKYAEALRRISFARRNSLTSRSKALPDPVH